MKTYGQFCPLAKACEVLAERWTPLVLRELLCGSTRFGEIHRGVPLMSRTLLVDRLRALEAAGVIRSMPLERGRGRAYHLTQAGEELRPLLAGLGRWGERWARRHLEVDDLDAGLLLWSMRAVARAPGDPERRVVVRIELTGLPRGQRMRHTWWLVLHRGAAELCLRHPGFDSDAVLRADLAALTLCYLGRASLAEQVRAGQLSFEGPRALVRELPSWLGFEGHDGRRDVWAPILRRAARRAPVANKDSGFLQETA